MKDSISPRTGILECNNGSASFYEKNFEFCITDNHISQKKIYEAPDMYSLVPDNHFLKGLTHDGRCILIYVGELKSASLPSSSPFSLRTSSYLVQDSNSIGKSDWSYFDRIEFQGGVLNNLFSSHYISVDFNSDKFSVPNDDFTLSGTVETSYGKIDIDIGWYTTYHSKPQETNFTHNTGFIRCKFAQPISVNAAFENIENFHTLVKFLSYRSNVEFDSIYLQKNYMQDTLDGPVEYSYNDAQVFIRHDFSPSEKDSLNSICIDELGNNVFNLLSMIYKDTPSNPLHLLDFLPTSDEAAKWITGGFIRDVATFAECEFHQTTQWRDSKSKKSFDDYARIQSLISKFEQTLSQDEFDHGSLPENTRQAIMRNLKKIALPSKNTDFDLYEAYKHITYNIIPHSPKILTENDIKEFREYRNGKAHGKHVLLNTNIGITSLYLVASGYCSILHRAGFDDATLKQLCNKHFLQ